jgi:hypothetical protein
MGIGVLMVCLCHYYSHWHVSACGRFLPVGCLLICSLSVAALALDQVAGLHDFELQFCTRIPGFGYDNIANCHTFRAKGVTEYVNNGGKLEIARQMANHESVRTTGLYDRCHNQISFDEVEWTWI